MVLRASAEADGMEVDLTAIADPARDPGIPAGRELLAFSDALLGTDTDALDAARDALLAALGGDGLVGAAMIAANFSRNDRIANATGIPLEPPFVEQSADFRDALGINDFPSARNTLGSQGRT